MTLQKSEKAKKRNKDRIKLPGGASCTEPHVNPDNWKTARASLKNDWYVKVNYYDADGKRKDVVRKNMNKYVSLADRQMATQVVIDVLKADLLAGWNPITGEMPAVANLGIAEASALPVGTGPHSSLRRALAFGVIKRYKYRKRNTPKTGSKFDKVLIEVRSYIRHFSAVAVRLGIANKPIAQVRRRDVLDIMETLAKERKWGYASWNNCLAYLSAIWKTLITYEVTENNPVTDIPDQSAMPVKKQLLTPAQREKIREHLQKTAPAFLRAIDIFFASGCREEEMCRVQGKDVYLDKQEFIAEIRKGKAGWRRVTKAITDAAMPAWREAMEGCGPEDYVFSSRWRPGPQRNGGEKYNRHWKRYVKEPLGIDADMYALKHLHTTELATQNEQMAADFNSHADTRMNEKHYDQLSEARKLEIRKRQNLKF